MWELRVELGDVGGREEGGGRRERNGRDEGVYVSIVFIFVMRRVLLN